MPEKEKDDLTLFAEAVRDFPPSIKPQRMDSIPAGENPFCHESIKPQRMDSIPAGENPFCHDHYNMGERLGHNVYVMFENFPKDRCPYLIVVNTETGERVRLMFLNKEGV